MSEPPKFDRAEFERNERRGQVNWWSIAFHVGLTLLLAGAASATDDQTVRFGLVLAASAQWPLTRMFGEIFRGEAENDIVMPFAEPLAGRGRKTKDGGYQQPSRWRSGYWNKQTLWIFIILGVLLVVKFLVTGEPGLETPTP